MATYELERLIGQGGVAEVFRARAKGAGGFERLCAVKRLRDGFTSDPESRLRFLDEARIAGGLRHPGIVAVIDFFETDGRQHLVMEYVDGITLEHACRQGLAGRFMAPELALHVARRLSQGLEYVHGQGVLHRDISACNVLLSRHGEVMLSDFGLADAPHRLSSTAPGELFGKAAFLSPERLRGEPAVAADDLFAAGVVVERMLAAIDPRRRRDDAARLLSEAARELRAPRASRCPSAAALRDRLGDRLGEHAESGFVEERLGAHVRDNPQPRGTTASQLMGPDELDEATAADRAPIR